MNELVQEIADWMQETINSSNESGEKIEVHKMLHMACYIFLDVQKPEKTELQTDSIDKLFLELSQVTKATTSKEMQSAILAADCLGVLKRIMDAIDGHCEWSPHPEVDTDSWSEDAHVNVTLTVEDCREIKRLVC